MWEDPKKNSTFIDINDWVVELFFICFVFVSVFFFRCEKKTRCCGLFFFFYNYYYC